MLIECEYILDLCYVFLSNFAKFTFYVYVFNFCVQMCIMDHSKTVYFYVLVFVPHINFFVLVSLKRSGGIDIPFSFDSSGLLTDFPYIYTVSNSLRCLKYGFISLLSFENFSFTITSNIPPSSFFSFKLGGIQTYKIRPLNTWHMSSAL